MRTGWLMTALVVGLTASAWAQPPAGIGRRGPPDETQLNLEPQRAAQVRDVQFAHRQKMIELQAASQQAHLAMQRLLSADPVDEAEVMTAVERSGQAMTEIQKERTRHYLELRGIVGVEQALALCGLNRPGAGPRGRMDQPPRHGFRGGDQAFNRRGDRPDRPRRGGPPNADE